MTEQPPSEPDPYAPPSVPPPSGSGPPVPPPAYYPQAPPPAQPPTYGYGQTYPPAGPGQPAAPGYGYASGPTTSGRAVAVMVLGIVGIVMLCAYGIGLVCAIVALALAPGAKREIAASNGWKTGEGMVKAGVICSWIAVGLFLVFAVIIIIGLVVGSMSSPSRY